VNSAARAASSTPDRRSAARVKLRRRRCVVAVDNYDRATTMTCNNAAVMVIATAGWPIVGGRCFVEVVGVDQRRLVG